jgi:hypothetical protein
MTRRHFFWLWGNVLGLLAFSGVSTLLLGDKGFVGDDWAILSFPFWYEIPRAFTEGALVMRRPMQSVYYGLALKATQYNAALLFFLSMAQLALAYGLMGWAVLIAFPGRVRLAVIAVIFGFLLPISAPGAYWLSADNMRLAAIFYWLSVLLWQRWARSPRWGDLPLLAVFAYLLNLLSYEAFAAMPLATLLLVYPVAARHHGRLRLRQLLLGAAHIAAGHGVALLLFLYVRGVYRIENHIDPANVSPWELLWTYLIGWTDWLWRPVAYLVGVPNLLGFLLGTVIALGIGGVLWRWHRTDDQPTVIWLVPLTAVVIMLVGIAPFVAAGFSIDTAHPVGSRGYIASAFGAALFVAYLLDRLQGTVYRVGVVALALICGVNAAFHLNQRIPYQEAAVARQNLYFSLREVAPGLLPETTLLYLNYNWQLYDGLAMVQWEMSANYQTEMFYGDRDIQAAAVLDYPTGFEPVVRADGLYVPGGIVPLDQVVIVERIDDGYRLVDTITPEDDLMMTWEDGITQLETNPARIVPDAPSTRFQRLIGLAD